MARMLVIFLLLFLAGCGDDGRYITIHEVDMQTMQAISDQGVGGEAAQGHAKWNDETAECEIWVISRDYFLEVEIDRWHAILGHEVRHCFEGDFH